MQNRKTNRLSGYDYGQVGAYFITTVVKGRHRTFGEIQDGKIQVDEYGDIVFEQWQRLQKQFPELSLDEAVVMPNHFHGILNLHVGTGRDLSLRSAAPSRLKSVSELIGAFKTT